MREKNKKRIKLEYKGFEGSSMKTDRDIERDLGKEHPFWTID